MYQDVRIIYVDLDQDAGAHRPAARAASACRCAPTPRFFLRPWFGSFKEEEPGSRSRSPIAARLDVANLPLNQEFLSFLKEERAAGQRLVLVTAAPYEWASRFRDTLASSIMFWPPTRQWESQQGERKLEMILKTPTGSLLAMPAMPCDRPAHSGSLAIPIMVGARVRLAGKQAEQGRHHPPKNKQRAELVEFSAPDQWSKNFLVFGPAIAAHRVDQFWSNGLLAFFAFSLVASALYLWNDFCDIDLDRGDPEKRFRVPGRRPLRPSHALIVAALLLLAAGIAALLLPLELRSDPGSATDSSTSSIPAASKMWCVLDLLTLTVLLLTRVFAGAAACGVHVSMRLFAFVFFSR